MTKVSELTGAELDYWVAKAEGVTGLVERKGRMCHEREWDPEGRHWDDDMKAWKLWEDYAPSQEWVDGGPIIERELITTVWDGRAKEGYRHWNAYVVPADDAWPPQYHHGETALIAAMRAYVACKFGEDVEKTQP